MIFKVMLLYIKLQLSCPKRLWNIIYVRMYIAYTLYYSVLSTYIAIAILYTELATFPSE